MRKDARQHRAQLLEAATKIFVRGGCGVPLELILEETGLGRGTLYRHFKSRGDLIVAVLEAELERVIAYVDARRRTESLLKDFLREYAEIGLMAVSAMNTLGDAKTDELISPLQARANKVCKLVIGDAISLGVASPRFDIDDLLLLMRMVIAAASQETSEEGRKAKILIGIATVFEGYEKLNPSRPVLSTTEKK